MESKHPVFVHGTLRSGNCTGLMTARVSCWANWKDTRGTISARSQGYLRCFFIVLHQILDTHPLYTHNILKYCKYYKCSSGMLLPQQHECQILMGNQLVVQEVPIGLGTGNGRRTVAGLIEVTFDRQSSNTRNKNGISSSSPEHLKAGLELSVSRRRTKQ